ncbi:MAG: hypothetical protein JSS83_10320 [Cyanobacteria bacterium SZAS LIN-3]|nr:hypothetical protein [Cyanobacteria bacterium SZAS LIN-3]
MASPPGQSRQPKPSEALIDGWRLSQHNREVGNVQTEVCKHGVRITVAKSSLVVIATAPWKEAYLFCTKTGNIYKTPVEKFANPYLRSMALFDGGSLTDCQTIPKGPIESVGVDCQLRTEKPGFAEKQLAKRKQGLIAARSAMNIKHIVTDKFKADPRIAHIMAKMFAIPVCDSVPLQFTFTSVSYELQNQLNTTKVTPIKIKLSDFHPPAGLKEVKEGIAVLVPEESDGALDLMMMGRTKTK